MLRMDVSPLARFNRFNLNPFGFAANAEVQVDSTFAHQAPAVGSLQSTASVYGHLRGFAAKNFWEAPMT
jgi:hypothetical protein